MRLNHNAVYHWFACRRIRNFCFVTVKTNILRQSAFQAIPHQGLRFFTWIIFELNDKANLSANPAGMFAKGSDDTMAGLDGTIGKSLWRLSARIAAPSFSISSIMNADISKAKHLWEA